MKSAPPLTPSLPPPAPNGSYPAPLCCASACWRSFATLWLAPRLAGFLNRYPHIQVELLPAIQLANVAAAEVDLAIRYGKGDWPDVRATRLMAEVISPVCSPAFKASQLPTAPC